MFGRFPRIAGLILLGSLLAARSRRMSQSSTAAGPTYTINLKSRQFTPAPGLQGNAIRATVSGRAQDRVHFLLQLTAATEHKNAARHCGTTAFIWWRT